jgi:hypothetical protein
VVADGTLDSDRVGEGAVESGAVTRRRGSMLRMDTPSISGDK